MTARRPIFRDGERLTAQRLNDAFGSLDDRARRAQLGTVGAGVAVGFQLSAHASGPATMLRIEPGLAIDGAGRFLVSASPHLVPLREIEDQTGPLAVGARVLVQVHGRTPAVSSTDPCAHLRPEVVDERPAFAFVLARGVHHASLATMAGMPAWSELSGRTAQELAVTLGSKTILSDTGGFSVSMVERQGLAPRADAVHNSFGQPVMTLRNDAGHAEVRFLARASGDDLTATRVGASGAASAAGFAPSDARVFLVNGGAAGIPAGLAGTAAIPLELDLEGGPIDAAGLPLEMADATAGSATVRARRASKRPSLLALGVSAAPAYVVDDVQVVPLATAGLVSVRVRGGESGVPLGAPLQLANESELAVVTSEPAVIVARAAQRTDARGGVVTILAWVSPAQFFASPVSRID
jgi:hypothetical protein